MERPATTLAHRLGRQAEAVCRHYLSNGRREGRYWLVGDIRNSPGRSLYVRLDDMEKGPAGKWTDAATGDHGDLLDLIARSRGCTSLRETLDEARNFLSLPIDQHTAQQNPRPTKAKTGSPQAARRLFAASRPLIGTVAQSYLCHRSISRTGTCAALRFHPHCFYRPSEDDSADTSGAWPALIAAVTDLSGSITGVHRTWLDPAGHDKAPVAAPRRAMGNLLGHAIRFGPVADVMIAGEGIETVLSLREIMPTMHMAAATSSAHLAAMVIPPTVRRLYVARDRDAAGSKAFDHLAEHRAHQHVEVIALFPQLGDFNDDLCELARDDMIVSVSEQLASADRTCIIS